ncbi:uncharacterized protein LOC128263091 [Drosophila gunungcola]|nr:uncharacterized protein LOC128263091 [Drosophila gunungcola]
MESNLWKTLQEVEKVEVSFKKTLRNINGIQSRYKMVSSLRKKNEKRKESFEAEIQAAITENKSDKLHKTNKVKKNKPRMVSKKQVKKAKPVSNKSQRIALPTLQPNLKLKNVLQIEEPFVCLQTNCVYDIHKTTTHAMTRKPYGALIRKLYRAASHKNRKENFKQIYPDNQILVQQNYKELYPDPFINTCSSSSCCLECS